MATGNPEVDAVRVQPAQTPISSAEILSAMEQVVASKHFRTSPQCQNLLRYVVIHTLEGKEEELKERVIGSEVFGRSTDYNAADDPVVRIRASDVRKRLAVYYQTEGAKATVRIAMPSGSYRVFFTHVEPSSDHYSPAPTALTSLGEPEHHENEGANGASHAVIAFLTAQDEPQVAASNAADGQLHRAQGKSAWRIVAGICAVLAVLIPAGVLVGRSIHPRYEQFDKFWAPISMGSRPPIIYVGSSAVYRLKTSFIDRYQATHPDFKPDNNGREFTLPMSPDELINSSDLVPDERSFVTVGDLAAAVSITSMLAEKKQPYDLRTAQDVVYGDFRSSPVVLIGAFNNSWTIELNDQLPFAFDADNSIREAQGAKRVWRTVRDEQGVPHEDFALISRLVNGKSGKMVITVAGIDLTGTRAAAEFVCNPAKLDAALKKMPAGWQDKNLQLILHTNVLDYIPSGTEVVASSAQ